MATTATDNSSSSISSNNATTTTKTDPSNSANNNGNSSSIRNNPILHALLVALLLHTLYRICVEAYDIRLYAIKEFGRIIHEFDPYFNYRATEYLYAHGWYKFRTWFDYKVWYPLGRPVGTTIYPGMQVTSVFIKNYILPNWSINDICVFVPAWFGTIATLSVAWLTYECTRGEQFDTIINSIPFIGKPVQKYIFKPILDIIYKVVRTTTGSSLGIFNYKQSSSIWAAPASAIAAAAIMSIVPAHLLRSIGGGYDNESIAMTAMVVTFAFWCASLRELPNSNNSNLLLQPTILGVCTGIAYFYMVAAWGGYVFVLNMVGLHAGCLVLLGRYTSKLHRAYSAFYIVGTILAIQVPVVGWTPIKSIEQLGALCVFIGIQLIEYCEIQKRKQNLNTMKTWILRVKIFTLAGLIAVLIIFFLAPTGYFGPISARVRGLFVKHTKTGNPLVDSVAEHQAASPQAYFQYLHDVCYIAPIAFIITALKFFNDSSSFLIVYAIAAYFFSHRMVRLILLTAPIASALGGIFIGRIFVWMLNGIFDILDFLFGPNEDNDNNNNEESTTVNGKQEKNNNKQDKKNDKKKKGKDDKTEKNQEKKQQHILRPIIMLLRVIVSYFIIQYSIPISKSFYQQSHMVAEQISHPTIINKAQLSNGETVMVDDYREAYFWLRDNTPEDARVMAWWDYGYQITGIGNRTTIADGNTWNHEHIALLGRTLTGPEKEAHRIARHLADYVLIWAGGGGDDLAKSPHLRRIANSVYRGLCREPTCREFGFYHDRTPTKDMEQCLLYRLHGHGIVPGVEADKNRFREVFSSKYGKVRIFKIQSVSKESKEWVENNRKCDAPGSWFCPGQYPPALKKVLKEKKDFKQLEDFNIKSGYEDDSDYQKKYFENLDKEGPLHKSTSSKKRKRLTPEEIDMINEEWQNNPMTSMMYDLIKDNRFEDLKQYLKDTPELAHIRSEDGRGPMFWAHEHGRDKIIKLLKLLNVSETRTDEKGRTPLDASKKR